MTLLFQQTTILGLVLLTSYTQAASSWLSANAYKSKTSDRQNYKKPGGFFGNPDGIGRLPPSRGKPGSNQYSSSGGHNYGQPISSNMGSSGGGGYNEQPVPNSYNGYNGQGGGYDSGYGGGGGGGPPAIPQNFDYGRESIDDGVGFQPPASNAKCRPFYSLNCERFCPAGNSLDADQCQTCTCCPVLKCKGDCSHGVVTHNGCATCNCKTPPNHVMANCPRKWCTKECQLGFAKDQNGCPLCKCNKRQYKTRWHAKFQ